LEGNLTGEQQTSHKSETEKEEGTLGRRFHQWICLFYDDLLMNDVKDNVNQAGSPEYITIGLEDRFNPSSFATSPKIVTIDLGEKLFYFGRMIKALWMIGPKTPG